MLTKLLKYEAKTTARVLLPIGGGVLAFTLVTGVVNFILGQSASLPQGAEWLRDLMLVVDVLALIFVLGAGVFVNVQRFYKLLGEQGYLMLSLPVPVWQHITAKLICACLWSVVGFLYFVGGIWILNVSMASFSFGTVSLGLTPEEWLPCLLVLVLLLVLVASSYLEAYLACAIGAQFGQQRLLASIVAFFVLGFIQQILASVLLLVGTLGAMRIGVQTWLPLFLQADTYWTGLVLLVLAVVLSALVAAIKWVITQWLMTRRLNLV